MPSKLFESDRIRLRALEEDDLPLFHQWWSDPEIAHYQASDAIRLNQEQTNTDLFRTWFKDGPADAGFTIVHASEGRPIGFCNLWGATVKNRSAEVAIILDKPYWGRGLGTEALRLLVRYAFTEVNLHRLHLSVHAFNPRAIRAYEKVGFRRVGTLREAVFRAGRWHDVVLMDLLQREYLEGAGGG